MSHPTIGGAQKNHQVVWSFFGLSNFYLCFFKRYSHIATPLIDLLKKSRVCEFNQAFENLMNAMTKLPILTLLLYQITPSHLQCALDASTYAIGEVLIQKGHSIAYETRKLNDIDR